MYAYLFCPKTQVEEKITLIITVTRDLKKKRITDCVIKAKAKPFMASDIMKQEQKREKNIYITKPSRLLLL